MTPGLFLREQIGRGKTRFISLRCSPREQGVFDAPSKKIYYGAACHAGRMQRISSCILFVFSENWLRNKANDGNIRARNCCGEENGMSEPASGKEDPPIVRRLYRFPAFVHHGDRRLSSAAGAWMGFAGMKAYRSVSMLEHGIAHPGGRDSDVVIKAGVTEAVFLGVTGGKERWRAERIKQR